MKDEMTKEHAISLIALAVDDFVDKMSQGNEEDQLDADSVYEAFRLISKLVK